MINAGRTTIKKLMRATAIVSGFTLFSRLLGFLRDVIIAQTFGAGAGVDAFLVAFKIPNFMRRLFAEGAFSQAFVPVLSEYKSQRSEAEVKRFLDDVAGSLAGTLLLVTLAGIIGAPLLIALFAPGFLDEPARYSLGVDMLRLTFPYLLFISMTAFAGAILNAYGRFAIPAFTPVLLNLCMISAAIWLSPWFQQPIMALAWGVLIAGMAQFLFQLPFLYRLNLLPHPNLDSKDEGVKRIIRLMLPALFAVSVTQISLLIDTLMASFLEAGSVSWLYYADRLLEFPVGVFGMALATVLLPTLSKSVAESDFGAFDNSLDWGLRWVFLIGVPSTVGLAVLAEPMIATLFYRGEFSAYDVAMSAQSLTAYAVGLLGFVLIKVLASGFFARQNTRTPVKIATIAMTANICLNFLFIWHLRHAGLALATACSALLNASLLYYTLRRAQVYRPHPGWRGLLLRIIFASALMGGLLWYGQGNIETWTQAYSLERSLRLLAWIFIGTLVYGVALLLFGLRLRHLRHH